MSNNISLSSLGHTWIFDIDGTILRHNGYLTDEGDCLLEGAKEFFSQVREEDVVILLTARSKDYSQQTEAFLEKCGIRFDHIIYNIPFGERVLVNDRKPSGLECALAINTDRDEFMRQTFSIDPNL